MSMIPSSIPVARDLAKGLKVFALLRIDIMLPLTFSFKLWRGSANSYLETSDEVSAASLTIPIKTP